MKKRSKFYGIKFPFFGLKQPPFDYSFKLDSISIQLKEFGDVHIIDKYDPSKSLAVRYAINKDDFFMFDYTCTKISHILNKNIKWGIDSNCKVFDLKKRQNFKARNSPIIKVKDNLVWVAGVSYPYRIRKNLVVKEDLLCMYATIVYIDEVWVLKKFTNFHEPINEITI